MSVTFYSNLLFVMAAVLAVLAIVTFRREGHCRHFLLAYLVSAAVCFVAGALFRWTNIFAAGALIWIFFGVFTFALLLLLIFIFKQQCSHRRLYTGLVIIIAALLAAGSAVGYRQAQEAKKNVSYTPSKSLTTTATKPTSRNYFVEKSGKETDSDKGPNSFGPKIEAKTADEAVKNLEDRMKVNQDPALAAAEIVALEDWSGQVIVQNLTTESKSLRIDKMHELFSKDKKAWENAVEAYKTRLNAQSSSVSLENLSAFTSQMYMLKKSASWDKTAPTVVVKDCECQGGTALVIVHRETSKVLKIRLTCGGQPIVTEEWMGSALTVITYGPVSPTPVDPVDPTPVPVPDPDPPKPDPDPDPDPVKDPKDLGRFDVESGKTETNDEEGKTGLKENTPITPSQDYVPPNTNTGGNNQPSGSSDSSNSGSSSSNVTVDDPKPAPKEIPVVQDSHDTLEQNAGNNNGEFSMD